MLKDRALVFGVAAMTAVATAGWIRQPVAQVPLAAPLTPAYTPVAQRYQEPVLRERPARRVVERDDNVQPERETVKKKRSTAQSALIIGGGAAAGAAIGGLAGGGKGAAIGALGGGAAGLIYDRMTKNR